MISALTLLATLAEPPPAETPCPTGDVVGWVVTISQTTRSRVRGDPPFVTRTRGTRSLLQSADLLCEGDLVRNPSNSLVLVKLRIGGRASEVRAGAPPFRVERPGWVEWIGDRADSLEEAIRRYNQSRRRLSPTGVRGAGFPVGECITSPLAAEGAENFVATDLKVRLGWMCSKPSAGYVVTIKSGGFTKQQFTVEPLFSFDPALQCTKGCTVSVSPANAPDTVIFDAPISVRFRLQGVVRDARSGGDDEAISAGVRLIERGSGYGLLGASLLWDRGCTVPAAAVATSELYNLKSPELVCGADANQLPRTIPVRARARRN